MKAMLLAAGRGERLRPLTYTTAKPLIKVGGKSLIRYHIEALANAGITDLVINTSWHASQIRDTLGDGSTLGVTIHYSHEAEALETAGGVINALPLLGADPFFLVSADVWCDIDYANLSLPAGSDLHLVLVDNPPHNETGDFTVDQGRLLAKTSESGSSSRTYSGIGIFHPAAFRGLEPGVRPLREVISSAIARQVATATEYTNAWFDAGTVERLRQIEDFLRHRSG